MDLDKGADDLKRKQLAKEKRKQEEEDRTQRRTRFGEEDEVVHSDDIDAKVASEKQKALEDGKP